VVQRLLAVGIERKLRDQLVERQHIGGQTVTAGIGTGAGIDDIVGPCGRVVQPDADAVSQRWRHFRGKDDRSDQPGTDDPDHDLLDPGHRDVEDVARVHHRRQRDDRQRVGGQQEHVAAR